MLQLFLKLQFPFLELAIVVIIITTNYLHGLN